MMAYDGAYCKTVMEFYEEIAILLFQLGRSSYMNAKPKALGIFPLAMINVVAIIGLKNLPAMAEYGPALIVYAFVRLPLSSFLFTLAQTRAMSSFLG